VLGRRRSADPFPGFVDVTEIGRGAFATVHRATDAATDQPVALKVLHGLGGRRAVNHALQQEARALGAVADHPNIVTLHRVVLRGDADPILVMELCRGSLADRVARSGPLTVRESIATGIKLAGALETAHRAGVLHRDLKPSNVLLTVWDEPVLADFGIANLREGASSGDPRMSGLTVHHAAPEVLLGEHVTVRSDVYGLASVLHELLTGHPPFFVVADEDPASVQRRIIADPPPRLSAPGAPSQLRDLLRRSLAKDPGERPPTALSFARQLHAIEIDHGWPATPCRIEGDPDALSHPDPAAVTPTTPTIAATRRRDRLPYLEVGRGFDTVPPDERDLDPVTGTDHQLLPGRQAPMFDPAELAAEAAAREAAAREADAREAEARQAEARRAAAEDAAGDGRAQAPPGDDGEVDLGYRWRADPPPRGHG
jgi:serine/threonine protein kinase